MAGITNGILKEFKQRMKLSHGTEDDNLKLLLSASFVAIKQSCGEFNLKNTQGKELVFERARYAYNDSLEFFADNFLTEIVNFSISLLGSEEKAEEETEQESEEESE